MSDINSDLMVQEVDEEIRRERMHRAWKTYGKYLVGAAVGIVLVVAGREVYNWQVKKTESAQSDAFAQALVDVQADGADVAAIWQAAMPNLGAGYGALAQLRLAAAQAAAGKTEEALATYKALAATSTADELFQDMATLKGAMLVAAKGDLDAAKGQLSTIAIKGRAWYFSALEQLALIDLQQADLDASLQKFSLLADDAETPQTIRGRAVQFRSMIETRQGDATVTTQQEEDAPAAAGEGESQ